MTTCSCRLIDDEHVAPGWGCCSCRTYNGMHRRVCQHCGHPRPSWDIYPANWRVCSACGGATKKEWKNLRTLAGRVIGDDECPVVGCGAQLKKEGR